MTVESSKLPAIEIKMDIKRVAPITFLFILAWIVSIVLWRNGIYCFPELWPAIPVSLLITLLILISPIRRFRIVLTEDSLLAPVHVGRTYKLVKIDLRKVHVDTEHSSFGAAQITTDEGDEIVIPSLFVGRKRTRLLMKEIISRRKVFYQKGTAGSGLKFQGTAGSGLKFQDNENYGAKSNAHD
jgi:hypothetical protein